MLNKHNEKSWLTEHAFHSEEEYTPFFIWGVYKLYIYIIY
jgi:hypothetical protein